MANFSWFYSWAFRTAVNDIGFGVSYKTGDDSEELIFIPQKRVQSQLLMEDGSVTCTKPGTCKQEFFNSKLLHIKFKTPG